VGKYLVGRIQLLVFLVSLHLWVSDNVCNLYDKAHETKCPTNLLVIQSVSMSVVDRLRNLSISFD
jgi:hypothetical protein